MVTRDVSEIVSFKFEEVNCIKFSILKGDIFLTEKIFFYICTFHFYCTKGTMHEDN